MNTDLIITILCSIAIAILGLFIFTRNPKLGANRWFAVLSAALVVWTGFNYLSDQASLNNLLYTRLTFVGGVLAIYATIMFVANFPRKIGHKGSNLLVTHTLITFGLIPIIFAPQFIKEVTSHTIVTSYLYNLFLGYILVSVLILALLIYRQRRSHLSSIEKRQQSYVLIGIVLYAILAVGSNVFLPYINDNWASSRFGPLFTLILVVFVAYAAARHKLFDIRFAVARSVAYVASLAVFAAIYGFTVFGIARYVFGFDVPVVAQIVIAATTGIAALWFHQLRKLFDKLTNKLFYQDAYDAQVFFNAFNKAVVASTELNALLKDASSVISQHLKSGYCMIAVEDNTLESYRVFGAAQKNISIQDIFEIKEAAHSIAHPIIVADNISFEQRRLKRVLRKNDISLLARLTHDSRKNKKGIGYIILGPKRNGGPYTAKDVRVMEAVVNELIVAIQNAMRFEEIRAFNRTLQGKVDEATSQLRRTNAKLQQLDEAKDEFISMASHQLRTPLTSVKGYLSMVLEGDGGKLTAAQKKLLEEAYAGSQRMVYLISDFLNVSRMKTGKFVLEYNTGNLAKLVGDEINQLRDTAARRSIELVYHEPDGLPESRFDENKIRQAIMNLTDNAIYYSKPGSKINIELYKKDDQLVFKVKDQGIGVPAKEQKDLFEKFYRATNARKVRPDGTGIGLFMIKKVVLAHGGAIVFESVEGKGSTFGFTLPLKPGRQVVRTETESPQPTEK